MKIDNNVYFSLKSELKAISAQIRQLKTTRKKQPNGYVSGLSGLQEDFRAKHIAYCLLRGRTIEQIENRRVSNPPDASNGIECLLQWKLKKVWKALTGQDFESYQDCHQYSKLAVTEGVVHEQA
jgi:hypothetical protein